MLPYQQTTDKTLHIYAHSQKTVTVIMGSFQHPPIYIDDTLFVCAIVMSCAAMTFLKMSAVNLDAN